MTKQLSCQGDLQKLAVISYPRMQFQWNKFSMEFELKQTLWLQSESETNHFFYLSKLELEKFWAKWAMVYIAL